MKQILRYSFVALLAMVGMNNALADDVEFDFSAQGLTNTEDVTTKGFNDSNNKIVINFEQGTGTNVPKYYNTGSAIRCYAGNKITVKLNLTTEEVTKVVFTFASGEGTNELTFVGDSDEGSFDGTTWTGKEGGSMNGNIGGTSGHRRIQKMTFTLSPKGAQSKTATTIEFSGDYETRATCGKDESVNLPTAIVKAGDAAVAGATVTWESSNTEIATVNGNKLNIANGTQGEVTIKASYAGNDTYEASTKSYKLTVYKGAMLLSGMIKDVNSSNEKWDNGGELVSYWFVDENLQSVTNTVTFAKDKNIYLTDGTNNLLFYGTNSLNLKQGDVISGDLGDGKMGAVWGKLYRYNKLPEFAFTEMEVKVQSEGATVTPKTITPDQMGENINAYLEIKDAVYVSANGRNLTFKVGETEFTVRQNWTDVAIDGLEANAKYTLIGMGAVYNTTNQLYLISFEKTGDATGITAVKAAQQNGAIYNVAGQMVTSSYKGLVIKNGRKYIQK